MYTSDRSSTSFTGNIAAAVLEELDLSNHCSSVSSSVTSRLEDELWNMDLDDILDMPPTPRTSGMRSFSFTDTPRPTMAGSFKRRSSLPLNKLNVSFSKVEIRVYERILGENPLSGAVGGPSLGLGWSFNEAKPVDLDKFETKRVFQWSTRRRNSKELIMSPEKRERMARKLGFSSEEIEQNIRIIEKVQRQRRRTVNDPMARFV
jgi:hypothetical protein